MFKLSFSKINKQQLFIEPEKYFGLTLYFLISIYERKDKDKDQEY